MLNRNGIALGVFKDISLGIFLKACLRIDLGLRRLWDSIFTYRSWASCFIRWYTATLTRQARGSLGTAIRCGRLGVTTLARDGVSFGLSHLTGGCG